MSTDNNLFQHEDALLLGMTFYNKVIGAFGKYFKASNVPSYKQKHYLFGLKDGSPATGRGGWYHDPNGDDGKIPKLDEKTGGSSLAGQGANTDEGGQGLRAGQLFQGGDGGQGVSAGGGGGLFGGGSSFIRAGGGGGSSGCPAAYIHGNQLSIFHDRFDSELYDVQNEPEQLHHYMTGYNPGVSDPYHPLWNKPNVYQYNKNIKYDKPFKKGYESETIENELGMLIELNCPFQQYFLYKYWGNKDYWSFNEYCNMFAEASGNGFIVISKKNERIRWRQYKYEIIQKAVEWAKNSGIPIIGDIGKWVYHDLLKIGKIEGFGRLISHKKGLTQEISLEPGTYEVILYGASGGNAGRWSQFDDSYVGGFGGCQVCVIDVQGTEPLTLYAVLGERGKGITGVRAFNGGGFPTGTCTGGGGSTDLRWRPLDHEDTLRSRIAVAGGGGGIFIHSTSYSPAPEDKSGSGGTSYIDGTVPTGATKICQDIYKVNDQSIVRVEFNAVVSEELKSPVSLDLTIDIEDGAEGTLTKTVEIDSSGKVVILFNLDEVYPADTPTHQVTIETSINYNNTAFLGISDGFEIYIDTKYKINESTDIPRNPILLNCFDTVRIKEAVDYVKTRYENLSLDVNEDITVTDNIDTSSTSQTGKKLDISEHVSLRESVILDKQTLSETIVIEANDKISISEGVVLDKVVYIAVTVDPSNPYGTVGGAGYYAIGSIITLEAKPLISDCRIEWYKDGEYISSGDTLVISVTEPAEYLVKFIAEASLPYIEDGLVGCFDSYLNKGDYMDSKATIWLNALYSYPVFDTDDRGFVIDGASSMYDGIKNTSNGHSSEAAEWEDIL